MKRNAKCNDKKCPYHGRVSFHGRQFEGVVVSAKMGNTVVVKIQRIKRIPKYERYERRTLKLSAHNPTCINAKEGDRVVIKETRPLSKTVSFAVAEVKGNG